MDSSLLDLHASIEDEHWWFTGRRAVLSAVLRAHLRGPCRILDVGCGTGGNLPMLHTFGSAEGLDSSVQASELARARTGLPVHVGTLPGPLPSELGDYDAVCLFDVLEHVEDDRAALHTARKLLRPRGTAFITVPALRWLWSPHDEQFSHYRRYHRPDLERLVSSEGLDIVHCTYFCSLLLPPIATIRLARRLGQRQEGTDFDIPTAGLNQLLKTIFSAERWWVPARSFPLGSSLLMVARRGSRQREIAPAAEDLQT